MITGKKIDFGFSTQACDSIASFVEKNPGERATINYDQKNLKLGSWPWKAPELYEQSTAYEYTSSVDIFR